MKVEPAKQLDRIVVTPTGPEVQTGVPTTFEAEGYDQYGDIFEIYDAKWSVVGEPNCQIEPNGTKCILTVFEPGVYELTCEDGDTGVKGTRLLQGIWSVVPKEFEETDRDCITTPAMVILAFCFASRLGRFWK